MPCTRHLFRHSRSRCLHACLAHILPRVTRPILHTTKLPFILVLTPGDAAACSRMATDISRVYSDLTHAVFLPTHGRSLTRASYTHTIPLTHAGALTHGVSHTRGGSHTRAASRAHVVSSPCGVHVENLSIPNPSELISLLNLSTSLNLIHSTDPMRTYPCPMESV